MSLDKIQKLKAAAAKANKVPLYSYKPINTKRSIRVIDVEGLPEEVMAWNDQLAFHKCGAKFRAFRAGNRSGKSECAAAEVCWWADRSHPWLKTPVKPIIWAVGPTYEHIGNVLWNKIKALLPPNQWVIAWVDRGQDQPRILRHKRTGIEVFLKSAKQGREAFQGAEVDLIWLDEDVPSDIVDECKARTIDRKGRIIWTYTPLMDYTDAAMNWHEKSEQGDPTVKEFTASIFGNPYLPEEEVARVYADWPEQERPIRAYGEFTQLEGLIYNDMHFDKVQNVYRDDTWPSGTTYLFIDPGFQTNAAVLVKVDRDGRKWIIDEYYGKRMHVKDNAAKIIEVCEKHGEFPQNSIYMDIAAKQHHTGKSMQEQYEEAFADALHTPIMNVDIGLVWNRDPVSRIERTRTAMVTKIGEYRELMVHVRCRNWLKERKRYSMGPDGKPNKKRGFDHLMNATEYMFIVDPQYDEISEPETSGDTGLDRIARKHRERFQKKGKVGRVERPGQWWPAEK